MFTIPILNIKTNPLDALLAVIGYRLAMLNKSDKQAVVDLLADRKLSIQFGSEADGIARYYVFDNGTFSQYQGEANDPSLMIDFKDSATGVKLLTGGDVSAFMTAIQDKDMTLEGDYSLLMWFSKLANYIVPAIPEEMKPYVKKAQPCIDKVQAIAESVLGVAKQKLSK